MEIAREVRVEAPRSEVWRWWTTREGLESWLADEARVELRLGGPFEVLFDPSAPPGERGSEGCTVLAFLPERLLTMTWNAPPSLPTRERGHTFVVVELCEDGGGTAVTITHGGWPDQVGESPWAETVRYFERAWGVVADRLERRARANVGDTF